MILGVFMDNLELKTENELKELTSIVLFHGTSGEIMNSILSEGVLPWNKCKGHNWDNGFDFFGIFVPKMDHVYFASFDAAKNYAMHVVDHNAGGKAIIIEAELNTSKLGPDEDSRKETWYQSFLSANVCSHKGKVSVEQIRRIYDCNGNIIYPK